MGRHPRRCHVPINYAALSPNKMQLACVGDCNEALLYTVRPDGKIGLVLSPRRAQGARTCCIGVSHTCLYSASHAQQGVTGDTARAGMLSDTSTTWVSAAVASNTVFCCLRTQGTCWTAHWPLPATWAWCPPGATPAASWPQPTRTAPPPCGTHAAAGWWHAMIQAQARHAMSSLLQRRSICWLWLSTRAWCTC